MKRYSLHTEWELLPDPVPCQHDAPPAGYPLKMQLPGTTAQQQIGNFNTAREDGFLTEKYPFCGQIWLRRVIRLSTDELQMPHCILHLERTRMTRLWINGQPAGSENSLCTPHEYDISGLLTPETEIVLCIKNTDYPVPGGHMTSQDTQTNWIGVTGGLYLEFHENTYLSDLQAYPDAAARRVTVKGILHGAEQVTAKLSASQSPYPGTGGISYAVPEEVTLCGDAEGRFAFTIPLPENAPLWTEYEPAMIALWLTLPNGEEEPVRFGLRDFRGCGDHFELNGVPVMLRGRHDGMAFPLTGAAPTDIDAWLDVLQRAKDWGLNHIRFHTCCPPEAAFDAADALGIFMEPELPFWGTVDAPGGEKYDPEGQAYLIREGLRICRAFGNHPSFCMFSLGNELWGSKERLGGIIEILRAADPRPLYTQGSNNFQHMPLQLPQEDFWTGVRTGKGRLIRGSFADCDAPIGRMQTHAPAADWDYEAYLAPQEAERSAEGAGGTAEIEIQYGTGVRRVKAEKQEKVLVPTVPAVSHEVGQYNCYPDYDEIPHYTGVVEARNFEIFRERLENAGMGMQARDFFECAGAFSRECYKLEIEAAMRSPHLAGFQLLDLQDFPGQGTALVGMLNALGENKGFILPEQWRCFCGDLVPLARFDSFVYAAGDAFTLTLALRISRPSVAQQPYRVTLTCGDVQITALTGTVPASGPGYLTLRQETVQIPPDCIGTAELTFELPDSGITNHWTLTLFPPVSPVPEICTAHSFTEAEPYLAKGERVLLLPEHISETVRGFYCADFWNYHMFRIISQNMGKREPAGTMGLCIDNTHPVAGAMFSERFSTPQWYSAVTHSDCAVLDAAPAGYRPAVQPIDNVERNHRLGMIFETAAGGGRLLICTVRFEEAPEDLCLNRLHHALADYLQSDAFDPAPALPAEMLRQLFG